jgi:hypothetical protein
VEDFDFPRGDFWALWVGLLLAVYYQLVEGGACLVAHCPVTRPTLEIELERFLRKPVKEPKMVTFRRHNISISLQAIERLEIAHF